MLHNKSIEEIEKLPLFFIVGCPRSGTTLLQQILDSNPEVIIPLEARFITLLKARYFKKKKWNNNDINEFVDELYKDLQFSLYWNVDRKQLTNTFQSIPKEKISFLLLCKIVYLCFQTNTTKTNILLIGDKKPLHSILIPEIIEMLPEAKFIHIVRDYRAQILSMKKWFLKAGIIGLSQQWVSQNNFIEKQKEKKTSQFYTIRYEDLVKVPEEYTQKITSFLGLKYTPNMLNFYKKNINDLQENEQKDFEKIKLLNTLHYNLLNPVNISRIDTWQTELSEKEIRIADYFCSKFAERYGYQPMYETHSATLFFQKSIMQMRILFLGFTISVYHKTPNWLRSLTNSISLFLYRTFGFSHTLNPEIREMVRKNIK